MCLEVMGIEPKTQIAGMVALVDMAGKPTHNAVLFFIKQILIF
jgi:hypothetical protein